MPSESEHAGAAILEVIQDKCWLAPGGFDSKYGHGKDRTKPLNLPQKAVELFKLMERVSVGEADDTIRAVLAEQKTGFERQMRSARINALTDPVAELWEATGVPSPDAGTDDQKKDDKTGKNDEKQRRRTKHRTERRTETQTKSQVRKPRNYTIDSSNARVMN